MFKSCLEKQKVICQQFASCKDKSDKYQKIIELGKENPSLPSEYKTEAHRVHGCQSKMYLHAELLNGYMHFEAESDALISNGLAALLLAVYDGESPEAVLKCEPQYLKDLEITASLTPGRSNGLASLFLRMRQETIRCYSESIAKSEK